MIGRLPLLVRYLQNPTGASRHLALHQLDQRGCFLVENSTLSIVARVCLSEFFRRGTELFSRPEVGLRDDGCILDQ